MAVAAAVLEEVIMDEILPRLPMRPLIRCRCVCKSWNSLLYNPDFLSHLNHRSISLNPKRHDDDDDYLVLMNYYSNKKATPPYDISILSGCTRLFKPRIIDNYVPYPLSLCVYDIHLVGSVNGLVCMAFLFEDEHQFILWNPTIRCSNKILVPRHLNQVFGPLVAYGFGWDSVTNDYKFIISSLRDCSSVAVYSYNTNFWSNIKGLPMNALVPQCRPPCVIVNGCPYWSNWTEESSILKFDTRNNEFTYLNVPDSDCYTYSLINLNDCLALIDYSSGFSEVVVYSFDDGQKIWMKMYTIYESMNLDMKIYCFKYGGDIVFYKNEKRQLQLYDPKSCEIACRRHYPKCRACLAKSRKRKRSSSHNCGGCLVNGFSYTPSLVALQGMKALHL